MSFYIAFLIIKIMHRTDNWTNSFSIVLIPQKLKKKLLFTRNTDNEKKISKSYYNEFFNDN